MIAHGANREEVGEDNGSEKVGGGWHSRGVSSGERDKSSTFLSVVSIRRRSNLFPLGIEKIREGVGDEGASGPNDVGGLSEVDEGHESAGEHQYRITDEDNGACFRVALKDVDHGIVTRWERFDDRGVKQEIVEELDEDEDAEEGGELTVLEAGVDVSGQEETDEDDEDVGEDRGEAETIIPFIQGGAEEAGEVSRDGQGDGIDGQDRQEERREGRGVSGVEEGCDWGCGGCGGGHGGAAGIYLKPEGI